MADPSETMTGTAGKPIFADMDIPCPHCEYNLRGLIEPRVRSVGIRLIHIPCCWPFATTSRPCRSSG